MLILAFSNGCGLLIQRVFYCDCSIDSFLEVGKKLFAQKNQQKINILGSEGSLNGVGPFPNSGRI